jgi:TRAP-type C4-dicarboxylate transport system permease small subunit
MAGPVPAMSLGNAPHCQFDRDHRASALCAGPVMTPMNRLLDWLEKPINLMLWASLAAGTLMVLHVTVDVVGRYVFNRPLDGTTEIVAVYYMVMIAYAPWAWIAARDNHIVAGMFQNIGTPRFDFCIDIVVKIVTGFCVAVFTYQTTLQALSQTRAGEVWLAGTMYIPAWPSRWILPVSGGLMVLYLLLRVLRDVARGPLPARPGDADA